MYEKSNYATKEIEKKKVFSVILFKYGSACVKRMSLEDYFLL